MKINFKTKLTQVTKISIANPVISQCRQKCNEVTKHVKLLKAYIFQLLLHEADIAQSAFKLLDEASSHRAAGKHYPAKWMRAHHRETWIHGIRNAQIAFPSATYIPAFRIVFLHNKLCVTLHNIHR